MAFAVVKNLIWRNCFLIYIYAHKIISIDEVVRNVRPSQGSIFCDAPTQIQGEVTEGQMAAASFSELRFRMKELLPQICARKLLLLFLVSLLLSFQEEW